MHVHVPLAGSGAVNSDVYARKIYAGWVVPPTNLHLYHAALTRGTLHEDMDLDPGDCECEAFWMSVNRAANDETVHLAGFDDPTDASDSIFCPGDNTLGDWDDNQGCGHGHLNFHGPGYDFYLAGSQNVGFQFSGYDSDCWDSTFGSPHSIEINGIAMAVCYLDILSDIAGDGPDNDAMGDATATFDSSNVVGTHDIGNGNYEMRVNVTETPLTTESQADLAVDKSCAPSPVKAPAPFTCRVELTNGGPGLPTGVQLTDTINTAVSASEYSIVSPTLSWENVAGTPAPVACPVTASKITCDVGTVPLGGAKAVLTYSVTSNEGGVFNDTATASTTSTDPVSGNNSDAASVTVIAQANLGITKTAIPSPVLAGGLLTYTVTSTNAGPSSAADVSISDTLPGVTLFKSAAPSAGGTCTVPAIDGSGTVVCTWSGATPRNAARSVQIVVEVPGPQTITNAASTTSVTEDPDTTNNAVAVATQIICTIYGTEGSDALTGTDGFDVICGLGGNDSIPRRVGMIVCSADPATTAFAEMPAMMYCTAREVPIISSAVTATTSCTARPMPTISSAATVTTCCTAREGTTICSARTGTTSSTARQGPIIFSAATATTCCAAATATTISTAARATISCSAKRTTTCCSADWVPTSLTVAPAPRTPASTSHPSCFRSASSNANEAHHEHTER